MSSSNCTANAAIRVHSLRAANDNRRAASSKGPGRRTVMLANCGLQPVFVDKAAASDRLMQQWLMAANDNTTVCGPWNEKE